MDSFLHLHAIYQSASRWKIIARVYDESRIRWRITMWVTKAFFLGFAAFGLFASSWHPFFVAAFVAAVIWAVSFHMARSEVFAALYSLYPERLRYFAKNYQYIRYLAFKERLEKDSLMDSVREALAFVDSLVDPTPRPPITSHPFITFTLGAVLAVVGGAAGQWPVKYVVVAIMVLAMMLHFSYMILDLTRTPTSDLKEFRQFLLWARNETPKKKANSALQTDAAY
jgi:hypothetical protein